MSFANGRHFKPNPSFFVLLLGWSQSDELYTPEKSVNSVKKAPLSVSAIDLCSRISLHCNARVEMNNHFLAIPPTLIACKYDGKVATPANDISHVECTLCIQKWLYVTIICQFSTNHVRVQKLNEASTSE